MVTGHPHRCFHFVWLDLVSLLCGQVQTEPDWSRCYCSFQGGTIRTVTQGKKGSFNSWLRKDVCSLAWGAFCSHSVQSTKTITHTFKTTFQCIPQILGKRKSSKITKSKGWYIKLDSCNSWYLIIVLIFVHVCCLNVFEFEQRWPAAQLQFPEHVSEVISGLAFTTDFLLVTAGKPLKALTMTHFNASLWACRHTMSGQSLRERQ